MRNLELCKKCAKFEYVKKQNSEDDSEFENILTHELDGMTPKWCPYSLEHAV